MKPMLTACDRCGLRAVRRELELRGIIVNFCDECYWNEVPEVDRAETRETQIAESGAAPQYTSRFAR